MTAFNQALAKNNFRDGFDKNVASAFVHPPYDIYWDPRQGNWITYDDRRWRFIDNNLPGAEVDASIVEDRAGKLFDTITSQWAVLPVQQHQSALWDGRKHRWIVAALITGTPPPPPPPPDRRATAKVEYERKLAILDAERREGRMTDDAYKQASLDLWTEYKDQM